MSDKTTTNSTLPWKLGSAISSVIAGVAIYWGVTQSQQVTAQAQQLSDVNAKLAAATSAFSAAQSQVSELQQQLSARMAALKEEEKRDLPITISFRAAILGNGQVAVFKNTSNANLEVAAVFSSPTTGQQRQTNLVLPAAGAQQIGYAEGWAFASGHHIRLSNGQYRPTDTVVP